VFFVLHRYCLFNRTQGWFQSRRARKMITFLLLFGKPKDNQVKCSCGKLSPAKSKFCRHCGHPIAKPPGLLARIRSFLFTPLFLFFGTKRKPRKKYCPHHSRKMFALEESFCDECGKPLSIKKKLAPIEFWLASLIGSGVGLLIATYYFQIQPAGSENLARWIVAFFSGLVCRAILQSTEL
jgi:hypothetical protein